MSGSPGGQGACGGAQHVRARLGPLACAAGLDGDEAETRRLLEGGTSARDPVALRSAVERGPLACVRLLLEHGADPNDASGVPALHHVLDGCYRRPVLDLLLEHGADPDLRFGPHAESALHVAARRRRDGAVEVLLAAGADVDARTSAGRSAYAHAVCRPFPEVARTLASHGADTALTRADELCVALVHDDLDRARALITATPELVPSLDEERARVVADLASQGRVAALALVLDAGADIAARGLDGGTALHCAAWFAQPEAARLLIDRGAPLDLPCTRHAGTALSWVAHGSRHSGGAAEAVERYAAIAELLCEAGASLADAADPEGDPHGRRLLQDAVPVVRAVLEGYGARLSAPGRVE